MIIYLEEAIAEHPRAQRIIAKYREPTIILCRHYQEVFNPKKQDFKRQKQQPALILAQKKIKQVLPTPPGFGIGGQANYYFSHMLNCVYDCRYCFLQGMYQSAHYVIFVNYEDFAVAIAETAAQHEQATFFSGYDCDSLAFEAKTDFLKFFLPFFAEHPHATLELRSKSTNVRELLKYPVCDNIVVAMSFTPDIVSRQIEHGVPSVSKRLQALARLSEQGWKIGLRFDPLIATDDFVLHYQQLIQQIFTTLPIEAIHSVSLGPLRFPKKMYEKITSMYPQERLLSAGLQQRGRQISYSPQDEQAMKNTVLTELQHYLSEQIIFQCQAF